MTDTKSQAERNREHCKYIAECLDRIADGTAFLDPDTGEIRYLDDDEFEELDGCIPDDAEVATVYDYLDEVYSSLYIIDGSTREYESVELMVACGGPNIWVSTDTKSVELYWGGDRASYPLSACAVQAVDAMWRELWEMGA